MASLMKQGPDLLLQRFKSMIHYPSIGLVHARVDELLTELVSLVMFPNVPLGHGVGVSEPSGQ